MFFSLGQDNTEKDLRFGLSGITEIYRIFGVFKIHQVPFIANAKMVERIFFIRDNVSNDGFSDFQSPQTDKIAGKEKCNNEWNSRTILYLREELQLIFELFREWFSS